MKVRYRNKKQKIQRDLIQKKLYSQIKLSSKKISVNFYNNLKVKNER